jgi:predicted secreted protein
MKIVLALIMASILVVGLTVGCGNGVKAYSDPGETIGIGAEKEFIILIALESNPTTGYGWEATYDETRLELVEQTYELGEYAKEGIFGAGGTELFRFKALKSGSATITMEYERSWENEVLDQKVFTVDVK